MSYAAFNQLLIPELEPEETDAVLDNGLTIRIKPISGFCKFRQKDLPHFEYVMETVVCGMVKPSLNKSMTFQLIESNPVLAQEIFEAIQNCTAEWLSKSKNRIRTDRFLHTIQEIEKQRKGSL